jgi:HEPN domain-containing protein
MLLAHLKDMARAKLKDAQLLYNQKRYDSAFYLCGYAVEIALKARICRTLKWPEYRLSSPYQSFKTHDLQHLLGLSGIELRIKTQFHGEWSVVTKWNVERRYDPIGAATEAEARDMLAAARVLVRVFLG